MADSKNKGARSIVFAPYFFAFPSFIYTRDKVLEVHDSQLEITITPKQYLAHAPLIEPLGGLRSMIIYDGERSTKYQWVYTVLVRPPYGGDIKTQKFRLEILR